MMCPFDSHNSPTRRVMPKCHRLTYHALDGKDAVEQDMTYDKTIQHDVLVMYNHSGRVWAPHAGPHAAHLPLHFC
ncbi:MAG: hypothetical protein OHK0046_14850 [Anaerolineae bacterium]